ncbi:MAG: hypothetical protein J5I93_02415, partial [Pirellulaceae bacterium]|nr:hypothetical protein [Pirellulaceae bacterium]
QQLSGLGIVAREPLLAGLRHSDPEVRRGCRRVLAEVLELDYQRRLELFLRDTAGQHEPDLPGWKWYRAVAGDGPEARQLFADMQREEAALLESLEVGSLAAVRARLVEVVQAAYGQGVPGRQQKQQPPSLATLATMLLAQVASPWEGAEADQHWSQLANLFFQPPLQEALQADSKPGPLRNLVGHWARTPSNGQSQLLSQKLRLVLQYRLDEAGLDIAFRLIKEAPQRAPNEVAMAIEVVARLGGKPHAARLLPLLGDQRQMMQRIVNSVPQELQVRDVALAWLLQLTGQDPADYHLKQAAQWFAIVEKHPQNAFNFGNFFLESESQRDEAMRKWDAWLRGNPQPAAPMLELKPLPDYRKLAGETLPAAGASGLAQAGPRPAPVGLRPAEREQVRSLSLARQLIDQKNYGEASLLLGEILAADEDFYFQPDREVPLYSQLKAQAERMLGQMPRGGREAYELQYGALARRLLDEALERRDLAALAQIERKYFYTSSGADAAAVLGAAHRLAGRNMQAALSLQPLWDRPDTAERFGEGLALQLAVAWQRAGFAEKARETLQAVSRVRPAG